MDYEEERRSILLAVADGTMTPGEAAERLEVLEEARTTATPRSRRSRSFTWSTDDDGRTEAAQTRTEEPGDGLARVQVKGSLRSVEITGDPSISGAVAEGPHTAYRNGDVLLIETDNPDWGIDDESDLGRGFRFRSGGQFGRGVINVRRNLPLPPVRIRVNPALALEAEMQAGAMTIRGVRGRITAEVDAGSLKVEGFVAPIEVHVNAGSFRGNGVVAEGDSRIECNAGKVDLELDSGSRVRITGRADLGKITTPTKGTSFGVVVGKDEVGEGGGHLDVHVSLGAATIRRAREAA